MMTHIANYHSHIYLCHHATGTVADYLVEAERTGLMEIGISDHAPVVKEWIGEEAWQENAVYENMTSAQFAEIYLPALVKGKEEHPSLSILEALESEYLHGHDDYYASLLSRLDYLVLGVHYFLLGKKVVNVDAPMNEEELEGYLMTIEEALATGLFRILAHPDLFLYRSTPSPSFLAHAREVITRACRENGVYLEVNANGGTRYPREEFFQGLGSSGVHFLVNSDAHCVANLNGANVARALAFCERLGLTPDERMTSLKGEKR